MKWYNLPVSNVVPQLLLLPSDRLSMWETPLLLFGIQVLGTRIPRQLLPCTALSGLHWPWRLCKYILIHKRYHIQWIHTSIHTFTRTYVQILTFQESFCEPTLPGLIDFYQTTLIINIILWIILVHFTIYFHQGELLWYFGVFPYKSTRKVWKISRVMGLIRDD